MREAVINGRGATGIEFGHDRVAIFDNQNAVFLIAADLG
jgi:hypothetical protein